jgi:hypothetical protein
MRARCGNALSTDIFLVTRSDCNLYLYRANAAAGDVLASSENGGMREDISFEIKDAGKYMLEVKCAERGRFTINAEMN